MTNVPIKLLLEGHLINWGSAPQFFMYLPGFSGTIHKMTFVTENWTGKMS